ncbi:MAG: FMN-dependent NADH-azoreductase, partial [Lentisphaeria bacterium]
FLGLNDVTFVYAEGLNLGGDSRTSSIAKAEQHISKIVSELTA